MLNGAYAQDIDLFSNISPNIIALVDPNYYTIGMVPVGVNPSDAVNMGQLNGVVSSFNSTIASMQASSLAAATTMSTVQSSVTTLQGQMTSAQTTISGHTASIATLQDALHFIGDMKTSARSADHGKWLLCDGRAISRTTYASLFSVLGSAFGVGDGSTTFNPPNPKGRSPMTVGQGNTVEGGGVGSTRSLGQSGGFEAHALTIAEMPAHSHTYTANTITNDASLSLLGTWNRVTAQPVTNTSSVGSGTAHSLMHPWIALGNIFIYTG